MSILAAAVVDSRNAYHQMGDVCGLRLRPTVAGVKAAMSRYGLNLSMVHVGLAVARKTDETALAVQHAENNSYRAAIMSAPGGDVLLGELHRKKSGKVEEKMVDGACNVRIARYVDEIRYGRTNVTRVIVFSKDIDLKPGCDYAMSEGVPITVAAVDVVQHRQHPYLLLGPHAWSEMAGDSRLKSGHELRELLVCGLYDGRPLQWTVDRSHRKPQLVHSTGLRAVPAPGMPTMAHDSVVSLYPIDVTWDEEILGSFPLLVCNRSPAPSPSWELCKVLRRTAPLTIAVETATGRCIRAPFPMGGVVTGETVLLHMATERVLGRLAGGPPRTFDPDTPTVARILTALPTGGALAASSAGQRGLVATRQVVATGDLLPVVQIGENHRGPVWAAIGSPIAAA